MDLLLLAVEAAVYPTLLAAVVILLSQPRPRRLLAAYLAGGMTISITVGLIIVFSLDDANAVPNQQSAPSWTADVAVGGLLLLLAVTLATRADQRFRARRAARKAAVGGPPAPEPSAKEPWSERILARGSVPLVFGAALAINLPGVAYLIALKDIAAGGHPPAERVLLVLLFNLIMFALAEIPLVGLWLNPEGTEARVRSLNDWLSGHGRELAMGLCAVLGCYLVIRGVADAA